MYKRFKRFVIYSILRLLVILTVLFLLSVVANSAKKCVLHNGQREVSNSEVYELLKPYGKEYLAFGAQKITCIGDEAFVFDYGDEIIAVGIGKKNRGRGNDSTEEESQEEQEEVVEHNKETIREAYLRSAQENLSNGDYLDAASHYHKIGDDASALAVLTEHEQEIKDKFEKMGYGSTANHYLGNAYWNYGNKELGEKYLRADAQDDEENGRHEAAAKTYKKIGDIESERRCRELFLSKEYN